jgi:TRAP-type mannitol/chloroaromatic compound transport system permease large subunit
MGAMVTEMSIIIPRVTSSVYVVFEVAKRVIGRVSLESISKGSITFLLAVIAGIIIRMALPQIVLYLPNLMY